MFGNIVEDILNVNNYDNVHWWLISTGIYYSMEITAWLAFR